ncbi:MAG: ABC transporter permease [Rickettsiales bacterium]|nr:ABC transporter permease [Rickettsiales bacterium]
MSYAPLPTTASVPVSRTTIGSVHWLGIATLTKKEVWRFAKVWNQTILAPVITTLLFLAVLSLAMGHKSDMVDGLSFERFVAPGLIMMAIVQNAFANTSSSLILSKVQGVIIDLLMPPFKGFEIVIALVLGGAVRGMVVGVAVTAAVYMFVPVSLHSLPLLIYYVMASSMMLASLGVLGGIMAQSFDQMAALTNYIVTPLSFLSGTFYSIHRLPEFWQQVSLVNPFFYMIDGFRYALTGHADGHILTGVIALGVTNIVLLWLTQHCISRGWRLKS